MRLSSLRDGFGGVSALRGGVGFLSRLPVGHDETAWTAFTQSPAVFPLVSYGIGIVVVLPLLLAIPAPTAALLFVVGIYAVTGITHIDGVADLGDAVAAHGEELDRREIMRDTAVGAGGVLSVALVVSGLVLAAVGFTALSRTALVLVITAEVGAKVGMALLVCLGTATHEGLGSALTENATPLSAIPVLLLAVPAAVLPWPQVVPGIVTLLAAVFTALVVLWWAQNALGGVSGDVLGATNEIARVVALHAGVITWTLS